MHVMIGIKPYHSMQMLHWTSTKSKCNYTLLQLADAILHKHKDAVLPEQQSFPQDHCQASQACMVVCHSLSTYHSTNHSMARSLGCVAVAGG